MHVCTSNFAPGVVDRCHWDKVLSTTPGAQLRQGAVRRSSFNQNTREVRSPTAGTRQSVACTRTVVPAGA